MATRLATRPTSTNGTNGTNGNGKAVPRLPAYLKDVTVGLEMITPDMAGKWLTTQERNRTKRDTRVVWLKGIIERKEWELSNDCIVFDARGNLINGQHRLAAIEEGTISVPAVVLRGVPAKSQDVMDTALQRSTADALKLRGEVNVNMLAAGLRWIHQMRYIEVSEGENVSYSNSGYRPSTPLLLATFDANAEAIRDVVRWSAKYRAGLKLRPGPIVAIVLRQRELSPEDTEAFWDGVLIGAKLEKNSPLLLLRNALINDARGIGGKKMPPYRQAALICKAWNLWREGDTRQSLTWHFGGRQKDTFPILQ